MIAQVNIKRAIKKHKIQILQHENNFIKSCNMKLILVVKMVKLLEVSCLCNVLKLIKREQHFIVQTSNYVPTSSSILLLKLFFN